MRHGDDRTATDTTGTTTATGTTHAAAAGAAGAYDLSDMDDETIALAERLVVALDDIAQEDEEFFGLFLDEREQLVRSPVRLLYPKAGWRHLLNL